MDSILIFYQVSISFSLSWIQSCDYLCKYLFVYLCTTANNILITNFIFINSNSILISYCIRSICSEYNLVDTIICLNVYLYLTHTKPALSNLDLFCCQSILFRQGLWDLSFPTNLVGHLHCTVYGIISQ